jgi:Coenzyme PQQ synthesis protein D (PqqD)
MRVSERYYSVEVPNVVSNNFGGEIIIADYDSGAYYSLLETAAEIWLGLQAGYSARQIADAFGALYPASSTEVSSSVIACIEELTGYWIVKERAKPLAAEPWSPRPHPTFLAPVIERYDDLKELLMLDPVHDTAVAGWPKKDSSVS